MKILKAKEMAFTDENTINLTKIPSLVLMENAGRGTVEVINNYFSDKNKFVVVAGSGNNGGDGVVVARYLLNLGKEVKVLILADSREKLSKDHLHNLEVFETIGGQVNFINEKKLAKLRNEIKKSEVVIDAIFGTGFRPPVKGYREKVIQIINSLEKPVVAVDIPSGLSANSGRIEGSFIKANITVTFAYPKLCHILYPASQYCGDIFVVDISIDRNYLKEIKRYLITPQLLKLPVRKKDSHKYNYGHNLIIGGSVGKSGAVIMASKASTKAGAGLTTAIVPQCINEIVETNLIEEMSIPLDCHEGIFGKKAAKQIKNVIKNGKFSSITVGMGMSINENTINFMREILKIKLPMVIDADGLNNLSKIENFKEILRKRKQPTVLTPHIGEMSRLTKLDTKTILDNMEDTAKEFAKETGSYVILKSSRVLIATPDEEIYYSIQGNEGMATAGTGDVLSGIIGALINRLEIKDALKLGVYMHGLSGDLAVEDIGKESLKATDLIDYIPDAYKKIKSYKESYKNELLIKLK